MQIFIRNLENRTVALDVESSNLVSDLKQQISSNEGVPSSCMSLFFGGKVLSNDSSLCNCAVTNDSIVNMSLRLVGGGKVHGSLARAGKVKGQTPKVQKQDKKKKPTGRAKKRQQYNRRFVNVVASMGKKVGPNNNAARLAREEAAALA